MENRGPISATAFRVYRVLDQARPDTWPEVQALVSAVAKGDPAPFIAELAATGLIETGPSGEVRFPPPLPTITHHLLTGLREQHERFVGDLSVGLDQLHQLQTLVTHPPAQHRAGSGVAVEYVHGPMAPRDAGLLLQQRSGPTTTWAVLPDAQRLEAPDPGFVPAFLEMLAAKGEPDRVLLGPFDANDTSVVAALDLLGSSGGVEFRVHDHLPSWFGVNADHSVVLPATWGDTWPTSLMILTAPAIAGLARCAFDRLWANAQTLFDDDRSWRPLVRLMSSGATTESAARTLGISTRTARRRLTEAMRHYDAATLFELGVRIGQSEPR